MDDEWIPIKQQENITEMVESWLSFEGESVGWCFVCNSVIKNEADIIPGSNDHRCKRQ